MKLSEDAKEAYILKIEEINRHTRQELEEHDKETIAQYTKLKEGDKVLVMAKKNVSYGKLVEKELTVKKLHIDHVRK